MHDVFLFSEYELLFNCFHELTRMRISNYAHGLYVILNDKSGAPLFTLQCAIGLQETRAFIAVGGHAMSIDSIIISATTCVVCYRTAGFCRDSGLVTT